MSNLIDSDSNIVATELGNNDWIRVGTEIFHSLIEDDVFINFKCQITNAIIGKGTQVASKVTIGGNEKKTFVGRNSWIGVGTTICEGIRIGENCVIGAHSIIDQDLPDNSLAYGHAGLTIRKREFEKDSPPNFQASLENNLLLKSKGKYLSLGSDMNYSSAEIIGENFKIGQHNILIGNALTAGYIQISDGVEIGNDNLFEGAGTISIGKNSKIGSRVHIVSNSHDYHLSSLPMIFQPVVIGENVVIPDGVTILGGVTIPDHTVLRENQFIRKFGN